MKYIAYHALKTPVEEVFQKFAYLEVELWPVTVDFSSAWTFCSKVNCEGSQPTSVSLMITASFATTISENFLGGPELCSDERSVDIVRELVNVLAGQAFDIMNAGRRPESIAIPESLDPATAAKAWSNATPKTKLLLVTENEVVGGMIITVAGNWSSSWA